MNHKTKIYSLRIFHIIGAIFLYFSIGILIYSGFTGKHFEILTISFIALCGESAAVIVNKWDCPLHDVHKRLGDEKGFFGLFLKKEHVRAGMLVSIFLGGFAILLQVAIFLKSIL